MIFETHDPGLPFNAYVESIFHLKGFMPDHSIERVVPTGHVFLILELDGFERNTFDNDSLQPNATFRKVWVSGMQKNYISISAHDDSEMFVIQFKGYGSRPFLHVELDSIADRVVPGNEFDGCDLEVLHGQLKAAESSEAKFSVADEWLRSIFDDALVPPDAIIEVMRRLQDEPASKLNEIIDAYSGTQKHLISQFKKYVGITPKHYQRILRFNDVFAQMQGDQFVSWSDIAYRCGYSDQSHFIREFKLFSGFNPESFLKEEFEEDVENFFPLDRDG